MAFELVDKEDARGVIAGVDYGSIARIMARSPKFVLFNARGCHLLTRGTANASHWRDAARLFGDRPTIAQYEAIKPKVDEAFGEGVGDAVVQAWRSRKTVLVDGGGERMPHPNIHIRRRMEARYAAESCTTHVDLTGRIPICRQCGENLQPRTDHHQMGYAIQDEHPRSIEECQKLTNREVIAVRSYDMRYPDKFGHVEWFETWDGVSLRDPYFCDDKCAAKFGRRAAEAEVALEPGVEPTVIPYVPRDDVQHYTREERYIETATGRFKV